MIWGGYIGIAFMCFLIGYIVGYITRKKEGDE